MWRLVVIFVVACGAPARQPTRGREPPREPFRLVIGPAASATDVKNADELEAALAAGRPATAGVSEIVEIRWGQRVLDRAAIREVVEAYENWPMRNTLRERYGLADYDAVLRFVVHGYAAQLTQRFGIEPREVWAGRDGWEMRVGVRGLLGKRVVDWKTGVFSVSSLTYPVRPPRVPRTVETIITSTSGDYYYVKDFGLAYFRPTDATVTTKVHHGAVLRTYEERVEFVDANGVVYPTSVEITRPTPYVISRPGGLPQTGLTKTAHLVRLELDDSALGGSAPIIESVTVLDGTAVFPPDLEASNGQVWQRYSAEVQAAERAVAADEKATRAAFDARTQQWAKSSTGPVKSAERRYVQSNPTYAWDANAKTLTITFAHETHVIQTKTIEYPNPEAQNFHCPPGRPCAVPPDTLAHVLELEYVIAFTASYRIDSDGRITQAPVKPRLYVAR